MSAAHRCPALLDYSGGSVQSQTNAVVAPIDEDGATSDFYTFVAGDGVSGYTDAAGLSTDATTPEVIDFMGYGYAAWIADGGPVLVMTPDPTELLDDPAFSMRVSAEDNAHVTMDFESLPADFEVLVEPHRFAARPPRSDCSSVPPAMLTPSLEA